MPHLLQSRSSEAVKARIAASATPVERIFQTARGGILQDSGYNEVWTEARKQALTPAQQRSPLGRRPYDLRHAAVSLWLNSRVPATEVTRRAAHGVAVLLKIYAHCIDGQADAANQRKQSLRDPVRGDGLLHHRDRPLGTPIACFLMSPVIRFGLYACAPELARWRQERRVRRPVRISLTRISGCSKAAKCPPLPASP
jgi:hypothetical protein